MTRTGIAKTLLGIALGLQVLLAIAMAGLLFVAVATQAEDPAYAAEHWQAVGMFLALLLVTVPTTLLGARRWR